MSRVTAFYGVDSKVGTTMLAQSTAEFISMGGSGLKVLLAAFNGKESLDYIKEPGLNIEDIKAGIDSQTLDKDEVIRNCRVKNEFYVLGGIGTPGASRRYYTETAEWLLEQLKDSFDLIILDCGGTLDNGLALGGLLQTEHRHLVLTQQESALRSFATWQPYFERLGLDFHTFIVNRYDEGDPYDLEYIAERLGIRERPIADKDAGHPREIQVMKAVDCGICGKEAERDQKTLLQFKQDRFYQDIGIIANSILQEWGLDPVRDQRKKKWLSFT